MANIGLVGIGTIGSGVVKILQKNAGLIEKRTGIRLNLKRICDLNLDSAKKLGLKSEQLTKNFDELINDKDIDIIIELIGGYEPARGFILKAIEHGKHVVTANKAVLAKHGAEIFAAAKKNNVNVCFEAAVGGCIPIIKSLQSSYVSEKIDSIYGILNGTTNYVLTRMSEGMGYDEALKKAQKLGFAEADPSFDVEGKDAAQKIVILSSLAFNSKISDDIPVWGITKITANDLKYASELGYAVKLLAIAKKSKNELELRVHPTMIPKSHELCSVKNELNAIYISGENIKNVLLSGCGAGQLPTATVVLGDVIEIARRIEKGLVIEPVKYFEELKIKKIDEIESRYYLRIMAKDKPGVLAKVSKILGDNNISISGVSQKEEAKPVVPLILTTHKALEKNMRKALKEINKLDVVKDKVVLVRIEDFG